MVLNKAETLPDVNKVIQTESLPSSRFVYLSAHLSMSNV